MCKVCFTLCNGGSSLSVHCHNQRGLSPDTIRKVNEAVQKVGTSWTFPRVEYIKVAIKQQAKITQYASLQGSRRKCTEFSSPFAVDPLISTWTH